VHSGQHFDDAMSDVFFRELGIPPPDHNLGVGGGSHARMTAAMLPPLEDLLAGLRPDWVLIYGDTNTTLAAALVTAKLDLPLAHVESGLRSFNRAMPEEVNRVVADHLSTLHLCPTEAAVENLAAEGITDGVEQVGDVMLDTARLAAEQVADRDVLRAWGLAPDAYYLATVHRPATCDDPERLAAVLRAFSRLDRPVVLPAHPRTRRSIEEFGLLDGVEAAESLRVTPPAAYLEMSALLRGARKLLTDSGGMQKEAYFFGVPCVTLRDETEWVETVDLGWNRLTGSDEERIVEAALAPFDRGRERPEVYGDGHAADRCVAALEGGAGAVR
jgi:UDP-GlcNAc3NAcA epimerase